jgi:hypothetical protein
MAALPPALRSLVERASADPLACADAIAALEQALAAGRSPAVLIALAGLIHSEAEALVLSQLEAASQQALALIDEAISRGATTTSEVLALEARCRRSLQREHEREATLLRRAVAGAAPATELVELGRRLIASGKDDHLAIEILRRAGVDRSE